jgi:hypothetical protein
LKICHLATLFPGLAAPMNFCTFTREHKRIESGKLLRSEHFSRGLPVAIPPPYTHCYFFYKNSKRCQLNNLIITYFVPEKINTLISKTTVLYTLTVLLGR